MAVFRRRQFSAEEGICHMPENAITELLDPSGFGSDPFTDVLRDGARKLPIRIGQAINSAMASASPRASAAAWGVSLRPFVAHRRSRRSRRRRSLRSSCSMRSRVRFFRVIRRGAEIDVFADPLLNMGPAAGGLTQMEAVEKAFSKIGVRLHKLPKLHSKIVAIDADLLCIGSYNWLSADRQGQYARHETSFVYRGQHLEDEIRTILNSLKSREKPT